MSDGLDLFRERIRKLLEAHRRRIEQATKGFDPQVTLQKLLSTAEIARRQAAIGKFPTGIAREMGIPHYGEPGYPGSEILRPGMKELEKIPPVEIPELAEEPLAVQPKVAKKKKNWWEWQGLNE